MTISPVFRLTPPDADRYARIRARMLVSEPWAFAASLDDDRPTEQIAQLLEEEENAIFGVEAVRGPDPTGETREGARMGELVGVAGIVRKRRPKFLHRANLWGVYVEPNFRGQGLARAVVSAAIELARSWKGVDYVDLGVSENSPAAHRLYESLGFVTWGREPESMNVDGRRYDEIFMTLHLERPR